MMEKDLRPVVHWVIVQPDVTGDVLLAQVCLFGWMAYLVVLSFEATRIEGVGHFFNVKDKTAYKMPKGSKDDFQAVFSDLESGEPIA